MHPDIPCAALPSKMLPGVPEHTIVFPTGDDRKLFSAAVNLSHTQHITLVEALDVVYSIAADIAPGLSELDWADEATLLIGKGVWSPFVAVIAAQQHCDDEVPRRAYHVWLRTTIEDARHADANYLIGNGRSDGKGGSYRATVVQPVDMAPCYTVAVDVKTYPCRVTKHWLDAWEEFTRRLSC